MAITPYADANQTADAFISLLKVNGISVPIGSEQEKSLRAPFQLLQAWRTSSSSTLSDPKLLRDAAGVLDLASKILSVECYPDFARLTGHLKLFEGATNVSIGQNSKGSRSSGTDANNSNKICELYIGALAVLMNDIGVTNVELEDAKGNNPDVMFDYCQKKWAIAIKTIHSPHGQTLFEKLTKGADQIKKSSADKGIIIINVKNEIDHSVLWNPQTPFVDEVTARDALTKQIELLIANINKDRLAEDWQSVFSGTKAVPPVLFMAQSLMAYDFPSVGTVPMPLKMFYVENFGFAPCPEAMALARELNEWMQAPLS